MKYLSHVNRKTPFLQVFLLNVEMLWFHVPIMFPRSCNLVKLSVEYRAIMFSPITTKKQFSLCSGLLVNFITSPLFFFFSTATFACLFTSTDLNICYSLYLSKGPVLFLSSCPVSKEVKFPFKAELQTVPWPLLLQLSAPGQHLRQTNQRPASPACNWGEKSRL